MLYFLHLKYQQGHYSHYHMMNSFHWFPYITFQSQFYENWYQPWAELDRKFVVWVFFSFLTEITIIANFFRTICQKYLLEKFLALQKNCTENEKHLRKAYTTEIMYLLIIKICEYQIAVTKYTFWQMLSSLSFSCWTTDPACII